MSKDISLCNKERKYLQQMPLNQSKSYLKSYIKINPRGIIDLNMKVKTIKLIEYNTGNIIMGFK